MKKILLCLMILVVSTTSFSQQTDTSNSSQQIDASKINTIKYYLHKSRRQLIVGTILLGIGVTTIILINKGTILLDNPFLPLLGALCAPVSIPFYISSLINKKSASRAITYLKMERVRILQQTVTKFHSYPAISVKINL